MNDDWRKALPKEGRNGRYLASQSANTSWYYDDVWRGRDLEQHIRNEQRSELAAIRSRLGIHTLSVVRPT